MGFSGDCVGIAFRVLFFRQHLRSGLRGDVSLAGDVGNDGAADEALEPDQNPMGEEFGRHWPQWLAIAGVLFIPFLAGWSIFLSRRAFGGARIPVDAYAGGVDGGNGIGIFPAAAH